MIIHRVHVRRFRKLADQVLECGSGLNVIRGRNDAGKSTLHEAFSAALFPIRPSDAQRYGPWGNDHPGEITVEFEADGRAYRLHKDFASRTVELCSGLPPLEGGDRRVEAPKAVEAEIGRILGLTSLSLFRATAHIRQGELAAMQDGQAEIGTRLSRIVTGGDSDAGRILKDLDEHIRQMEVGLRHPSKKPGPLKRYQDQIARLTGDRARFEAEVSAIEQAAADRDRLAGRLADLERQVGDQQALLEANRHLLDLDGKRDALSRRGSELQSLLERIDAAGRALDAARGDAALAIVPVEAVVLQTLRQLARRAEILAMEVASDARAAPAKPPSPHPPRPEAPALWLRRRRRFGWTGAFAGITALAILARATILALGHQATVGEVAGLVAIAILAGAIGLLSGVAASLAHRQSLAASEADARSRAQERAEQAAADRRRALEEAREALGRQLHALGVATVQEATERQARREQAARHLDTSRHLLEALLGGRSRDSVAQELQRVVLDLGAATAQRDHPDLALKRLEPAAFQRLQAEAARGARDLDEARTQLMRLEARLSGRSPYEDLARVEEELADAGARSTRLERQLQVLRLTRDVLFEAHRHTIVPGKERLEQLASDYLRALSGGAYARVQVDADTLAPRVWVGPPKLDGWANVERREIGSGAVDQCYLALRLGLVALLCQDRRPPVFLDDPFLTYDEERQASAMGFLRHLARERQIFLFTCRGVYDAYADRVLVLGEVHSAPEEPIRVISSESGE